MAYIKQNIKSRVLDTSDEIEQLWVSFRARGISFAVGTVYRPPNLNYRVFLNELESTLSNLFPMADTVILTGDLNIDILKCNHVSTTALMDMVEPFDLKQLIVDPTRSAARSATLLDLIFISNTNLVEDSGVYEVHGMSGHDMVFCKLRITTNTEPDPHFVTRSYRDLDYDSFLMDLYRMPFFHIFDLDNANIKADFLTQLVLAVLDVHVPLKLIKKSRTPCPWITDTIKHMQKLRDKAYNNYRNNRSEAKWEYYKSARNLVNTSIIHERRAYFESQLNITNDCWKALRNTGIFKRKNMSVLPHLGSPNDINNYFIAAVSGGGVPDLELVNFYNSNKRNNLSFGFRVVEDMDVERAINSIKSNALGHDRLNIKCLKLCCPHILPYIRDTINACIETCVFPMTWKKAVIKPLSKISKPTVLSDLRPISILPVLAKVAEKILYEQMVSFVEENDILPQNQSGFRRGYSCTTALIHIIDDIIRETDRGNLTVLCLLDYSKAFDTVNHETMASILRYSGFDDKSTRLLYDFLTHRQQAVFMGDEQSEYQYTSSGVPQGSILSPLLYALYTSNFNQGVMHCKTHFYADDTQIYYSFPAHDIKQACVRINSDLEYLRITSSRHGLKINQKKSNVIMFGPQKQKQKVINDLQICVNNELLPIQKTVKNLGILIDEGLTFNEHVNKCVQRAYSSLRIIYTNRAFVNHSAKVRLCESLVLSMFNYGDALYAPFLSYALKRKIQKVQNTCIRLIFGLKRRDHVSCKLPVLKWLNMQGRRMLHAVGFYHKLLTLHKPAYLVKKLSFRGDVHSVNVRFKGRLSPPIFHTMSFKKCFSYQICKVINELPSGCALTECGSAATARRRYADFLFGQQCSQYL